MNRRNIGKFRISSKLITDKPEVVAELFRLLKCVPVRAEMLYALDEIEYMAISSQFPEIPLGQKVPKYKIKFTQRESGNVGIEGIYEI